MDKIFEKLPYDTLKGIKFVYLIAGAVGIGFVLIAVYYFTLFTASNIEFEDLVNKRKSLYIVALAGPMSNIIIAFFSTILFHFMPDGTIYSTFFAYMSTINILLALFNLLPIPPLDGSNIVYSLISDKAAHYYRVYLSKYGQFGFIFIVVLFNIYPQIIFTPLTIILDILGLK